MTSAAPTQKEPHNDYSIKQMNISSGLYYEEIGRSNLITNEWDLIIYFDLRTYWLELEDLKLCIDQMKYLCHQGVLKTMGYCNTTVIQFAHTISSIEAKNQLLKTNKDLLVPRQKRSPFNIVGNIAQALFGILDSNFADRYEEHIKGVKKNEDYLLKLLKNHSSIMEATANIIKKNEEDVRNQFQGFQKDLKNIAANSEQRQMFFTLALHTTLAISNYQRTQDTLLNLVVDTQHGLIAQELLTPTQLQEQLSLIRRSIPNQLSVPRIEEADNLLQIFKLFNIKGRVTKRNVLISLKLPLITNEEFQIFNMVPIPVIHEGHLAAIIPSSTKLLVNLQRSLYYPMMETELQLCRRMKNDRYLCYQHHPLYTEKSSRSHCEFTLLTHADKIPDSCKIQTSAITNTWTQLHSPSNWIFNNFKEETLDIICGESITPVSLAGTGILHLGSNCMIKHPAMIIKTYNLFHNEIRAAIIPAPNLSTNLKQDNIHIDRKEYNTANTLLNRIHEQQSMEKELPYNITTHDVHQYVVSYTLFAAFIIAAILYGAHVWRKRMVNEHQRVLKPSILPHQRQYQEANPA